MADYLIAKYIRLSIEDEKNDSLNVENQRLILDTHISGMDLPETADVEILEFVDNGYSGTSFERPGVQRLIELVRRGLVNCIIVKDFSRFGRNMIDAAYYIERVFPLYRTRFISLSDNFDSLEHPGGVGGLDVTFQFLIHEQYSRDLSAKVKSARRIRALRGESIPKNCAFGYKKVGDSLEIDEPAAETVRYIFALAAQGRSLAEITVKLYEEKRPTPSEVKNLRYDKAISCLWSKSGVLRILADEQYIGTYIAGKTSKVETGGKKAVRLDPSEWIRLPNRHPAIIEKSVFAAARERIDKKGEPLRKNTRKSIGKRKIGTKKRKVTTNQRYKDNIGPLRGKVICGYCGHVMFESLTKNSAFQCRYTQAAPDAECHGLRFPITEIEAIVFGMIRKRAKAIISNTYLNTDSTANEKNPQSANEPQIERIENEKRAVYESFILGEINADEYKAAKEKLDGELKNEKHFQAALAKEVEEKEEKDKVKRLSEDALKKKKLSKELADALIDKVYVYHGNAVEVMWKEESFGSSDME